MLLFFKTFAISCTQKPHGCRISLSTKSGAEAEWGRGSIRSGAYRAVAFHPTSCNVLTLTVRSQTRCLSFEKTGLLTAIDVTRPRRIVDDIEDRNSEIKQFLKNVQTFNALSNSSRHVQHSRIMS